MRRALYPVAAIVALALPASFVACDDDDRYVYTARRYDPVNACLGGYTPIERVVGEGADSNCAPTCLSFRDALYVTPVCPPLPVEATEVPASDPACEAALEAYADDALCDEPADEDGGEDEAGEPEPDAAEGDAGEAEDAGEDAAGD